MLLIEPSGIEIHIYIRREAASRLLIEPSGIEITNRLMSKGVIF